MEIIHETENYIVINKAPGEDSEKDVPKLIAESLGGEAADFFCVHRLDKTASGLLVYGRNKAAAADLTRQIQDETIQKTYLAIVAGKPEEDTGSFRDLLYKDKIKQKAFPVKRMRKGVKEAILDYKVLDTTEFESQVISIAEVKLHTGRFHQIRCQFASRKMPLLGDGKYGSRIKTKNLCLFCQRLSFYDQTAKAVVSFTAVPPAEEPWTLFNRIQ
ncbi:RluA family pseudouridine synthase [Oribacterium sp. WCC10]|uniref:RluA family pseudouridine synthase n=1 Tax=Oribacterium sp. WCC10 TaxID=1855343 RepID=UPI0008E0C5A2|nr:RluA family pseudouridine synthase [Oribacterium sp. WCC10]SFG56061.1 ribosomal large subunit pseudouridine synthase D [Oribacterium sp. WCC10]